jgi:hypothetical protein
MGILYINDVPHSSGRGVGRLSRMDFEISGRSRANALGGLIISQSGVKKLQLLLLLLGTEVLEKLLILLILMLLIILTGTTETDLDGQERLLKLLYLKVSLIMDLLCNNRKQTLVTTGFI